MHSDGVRAREFAKRARRARVVCEGEESVEVQNLRALEEKPEGFENWGVTGRWKGVKGEGKMPGRGDGEEGEEEEEEKKEFGRWLWRLE